jgi:hypothetical protein
MIFDGFPWEVKAYIFSHMSDRESVIYGRPLESCSHSPGPEHVIFKMTESSTPGSGNERLNLDDGAALIYLCAVGIMISAPKDPVRTLAPGQSAEKCLVTEVF